jgi:GxxExxY protein
MTNIIAMSENELATVFIKEAIKLHKILGPGLLESAYEAAILHDLRSLGLEVESQVPMPLTYKEIKLDIGYRLDLLIENKLIIELKAVENLLPIHYAQTLTYAKLSGVKLALLVNFNTLLIKDGIHRVVNNL